jgi:formylglycine-generating enzyme required for sulfatase activity
LKDFTITHIAGIKLSLPMLFKFIEAKGKLFQFQANDGTEYGSKDKGISIAFEQDYWLCAFQTTQEFWSTVLKTVGNENNLKIDPSYAKGKIRPVENVNYFQVGLFIESINLLVKTDSIIFEGKPEDLGLASLPSETQWEYAAASNLNSVFSSGDHLNDNAWYIQNTNNRTMPVGLKEANAFGLFDMSGNVWEWCQDDFQYDLSDILGNGEPIFDRHENSIRRTVVRGGSFSENAMNCRLCKRSVRDSKFIGHDIGFRILFYPRNKK